MREKKEAFMDIDDSSKVEELGLPADVVEVLKGKKIHDYGTLCCVTLGQLKEWGLEPQQIGKITDVIRMVNS